MFCPPCAKIELKMNVQIVGILANSDFHVHMFSLFQNLLLTVAQRYTQTSFAYLDTYTHNTQHIVVQCHI